MEQIPVRFDKDAMDKLKKMAWEESMETHRAIGVSGFIRRAIVELYGLEPITVKESN